jgi:hypothetical protein
MPEADIIQRGRRLEARDMATQLGRFLVGAQNDRNRVPTDDRADTMLDVTVPVRALLALRGMVLTYGVLRVKGRARAGALRLVQ